MKLAKKSRPISLITMLLIIQSLGSLTIPATTLASKAVHLNKSVKVTSNEVMLRDLFSGLGEIGDTVVASAPAPGVKLNLGPRKLRQIANQFQLPWSPANGQELARIERASRTIPLKTVRLALHKALTDGQNLDQIEIQLTNSRLDILVAADRDISVQVHDMDYDHRTRQFSAWVSAPANTPNAPRHPVKGRVYEMVDLPVPQRHIRPGEVIHSRDISWRGVRVSKNTYNTISSIEELIGQSARRPLIAHRLIRRSDVIARELVARGDFVTVHFRSKTMNLTYRGVAIESGARGDVIRIRNSRSKKVIEGKIVGPNVASIQLPKIEMLN